MSKSVPATPATLPDLARQINAEHAACMASAQDAVTRAIEVGRLLARAKEQVQHGGWEPWVEANCVFGIREAQRYMRAYQNRSTLEGPKATRVSHLDSLRGVMEALSAPPDRDDDDGDTRQRCIPVTEWDAKIRHWLCEQWWDVRATYSLMLDAVGWRIDDIADFLGRPTGDIEAILYPRPPVRRFTPEDNGDLMIDHDDQATPMAEFYLDSVMYQIDSWLEKACWTASFLCEKDGFGDVKPILRAYERRYQSRRENAEQRGIGLWPFFWDYSRNYEANAALCQCVLFDARHAVRMSLEADKDKWDPNLFFMWMHFFKALKGLNEELAKLF
jgi:hypothetical protein